MRDWELLGINSTTREVIEKFNINSNSSRFMDHVTGSIMSNGLLFTGTETVAGELVVPLRKVGLSGIVESDTLFDNFRMYFRESNNIVELDKFPVDLTRYNDNKPHFLYFKENLTYRVSDYIFGQSDEVLICRFIINLDSTWQQMYIMAQRAGTPAYDAGEEFYKLDGINVKSPRGLELSHTDGIVQRSGIEYTDRFSPDLYHSFSSPDIRMPLRYSNLSNEIDYTQDVTYNVDPNHYMSYDSNSKKKNAASERIRNIYNSIYGIEEYAETIAVALSEALSQSLGQSEYRRILNIYKAHMNTIYALISELGNYMQDSYFSTINLTNLNQNIADYLVYDETYFADTVRITSDTVVRVRDSIYFLVSGNSMVCNIPIVEVLEVIYNAVNDLSVGTGTLNTVPTDKFTLQRVLWDIYEDCLIVQYGDTVFDTVEDAIAQVGSMLYPVPFGRLIYIPLAVLVLKQGTTDINTDPESVILIKQYIYADSEQEGFADYIARSLANRALNYIYGIFDGTYPVAKSDTLKYLNNGVATYVSGDFYLEYDNLRNSVQVINSLNESSYDSKKALSANQGKVLNDNKLARDGSQTFTGAQGALRPESNNSVDLGTSSLRWKTLYSTGVSSAGNVNPSANNSYDLGTSSLKWRNLYVNAISGVSSFSATTISSTGNTSVGGDATVSGKLVVNSNGSTLKNTTIQGTLGVTGATTLGGALTLASKPTFSTASMGGFVLSRGESGTGVTVDYLEAASGKNSGNVTNFSNKSVIVSW